jgi:hypothetical protein
MATKVFADCQPSLYVRTTSRASRGSCKPTNSYRSSYQPTHDYLPNDPPRDTPEPQRRPNRVPSRDTHWLSCPLQAYSRNQHSCLSMPARRVSCGLSSGISLLRFQTMGAPTRDSNLSPLPCELGTFERSSPKTPTRDTSLPPFTDKPRKLASLRRYG